MLLSPSTAQNNVHGTYTTFNPSSSFDNNAIIEAARAGDLAKVRQMIEVGVSKDSATSTVNLFFSAKSLLTTFSCRV
jgi:hypothetical protein